MAKPPKVASNLPSVLSWARSVDTSEAALYGVVKDGDTETEVPVEVETRTVRGAQSHEKASKEADVNTGKAGAAENANIQSIDVATLPLSTDILRIRFGIAFHGRNVRPDICNNVEYGAMLQDFIEMAKTEGLYEDLGARYFWNVANARWFWRNSIAVGKTVTVRNLDTGAKVTFQASAIPLNRFPGVAALQAAADADITPFLQAVTEGLSGGAVARFEVVGQGSMIPGGEVWPSQEFANEDGKKKAAKGGRDISRILSSRTVSHTVAGKPRIIRHATLHSQKVGNAIRTIDEWHQSPEYGTVAVEAFGWVQSQQKCIRLDKTKTSLYTFLKDFPAFTAAMNTEDGRTNALFVLANIIRGGVYGLASKDDGKAQAASDE